MKSHCERAKALTHCIDWTFKGAVGAYLGLLSGLRRPPDLGYFYRRIFLQKVAERTRKSVLFYSSSQTQQFWSKNCVFGNFFTGFCEICA
jgi:hypothetical protein